MNGVAKTTEIIDPAIARLLAACVLAKPCSLNSACVWSSDMSNAVDFVALHRNQLLNPNCRNIQVTDRGQ